MEKANIIPFLDVAVGLIIIHALVALFVMMVVERVATWGEWRTKVLQDGLCDLLNDPDGFFVRALLCHPLVTPNMDYKFPIRALSMSQSPMPPPRVREDLAEFHRESEETNLLNFDPIEPRLIAKIMHPKRMTVWLLKHFYDPVFARYVHYYRSSDYRKGRYGHHVIKGPSYIASVVFADIILDIVNWSTFHDITECESWIRGPLPRNISRPKFWDRCSASPFEIFFSNLSLLASGRAGIIFEEPRVARRYFHEGPVYESFSRVVLTPNRPLFRATHRKDLPLYFNPPSSVHLAADCTNEFIHFVFPFFYHETPLTLLAATSSALERDWIRNRKLKNGITTPEAEAELINRNNSQIETDELRATLANWFDAGMDRITGLYKRRVFGACFVLSFLVALIFNIDTIKLTRNLWNQANYFNTIIVAKSNAEILGCTAEDTTKIQTVDRLDSNGRVATESTISTEHQTHSNTVSDACNETKNRIAEASPKSGFQLPIGFDLAKILAWWNSGIFSWDTIYKFIGVMLSAAAITLMAPIWFDLLTHVFNLRGTGIKPDKLPIPSLWPRKSKE